MKRKKTLLILSLVLLVAVVAIVAEKAVAQHIDKINTVDEEVFSVKADVTTVILLPTVNPISARCRRVASLPVTFLMITTSPSCAVGSGNMIFAS